MPSFCGISALSGDSTSSRRGAATLIRRTGQRRSPTRFARQLNWVSQAAKKFLPPPGFQHLLRRRSKTSKRSSASRLALMTDVALLLLTQEKRKEYILLPSSADAS